MSIKKFFLLFLLCLTLIPTYASAMEVTSPFGWRTHPITGVKRFHSGVDIAGDMGDGIAAPMAGVVSFRGYDPGGYGNYIMLDHPDGTQTLYGHCSALYAPLGANVPAGAIIAAVGSTGASTGPHVHVEYRINGAPVDPMPMLLAHGWSLSYDGEPMIGADGEFIFSDADEMPWDFGDFYDIASDVRKALEDITTACQKGLTFITTDVMALLKWLMVIDFALSFLLWIMEEEDVAHFIIRKFLRYGFIIFLVVNWKFFVNTMVLDSLTGIAMKAGGGGAYIGDNISDPSKIIEKGFFLATPVFNYLTTFSGLHLMANIHNVFLAMFLGICIVACFAFIGYQFFIVYIEFYILAVLAIVTAPFSVEKNLKFLGEQSFGSIISAGIKLMTMTLLVALIINIVKDFSAVQYDHIVYFRILLGALTISLVCSRIPKKVTELLSGSPNI